jgi:hypothetical protein
VLRHPWEQVQDLRLRRWLKGATVR